MTDTYDFSRYANLHEEMEAFTAAVNEAREQRHAAWRAKEAAQDAEKLAEQNKRDAAYRRHF
jgi:hypothetical protein